MIIAFFKISSEQALENEDMKLANRIFPDGFTAELKGTISLAWPMVNSICFLQLFVI